MCPPTDPGTRRRLPLRKFGVGAGREAAAGKITTLAAPGRKCLTQVKLETWDSTVYTLRAMSRFETLRRLRVPYKARAARLLAGAWVFLFAANLVMSGCIVPPAAAASAEQAAGAPPGAAATAHEESTRDADCCDAMRAVSAGADSWGVRSADRAGATLPGLLHRATYFPPAGERGAGAAIRARPPPPVPTYLLTLRLRA